MTLRRYMAAWPKNFKKSLKLQFSFIQLDFQDCVARMIYAAVVLDLMQCNFEVQFENKTALRFCVIHVIHPCGPCGFCIFLLYMLTS